MLTILAVAVGGALGSVARYLTMGWVGQLSGPSFPYGTLAVNILGSFIMGGVIAYFARLGGVSNELRAFVAVGILGGFTTFSAFSLDVVTLAKEGALMPMAAYIIFSVVLSVLALVMGLWLIRVIA